jgi:hypothetical protein
MCVFVKICIYFAPLAVRALLTPLKRRGGFKRQKMVDRGKISLSK